jgi:diguanylate cyclase (GGDEF)-like protein
VDSLIAGLRVLTSDNPVQQQQIAILHYRLLDKLRSLKQAIETRKNSGFEAAWKLVISGREKEQMDLVRSAIAEMEAEEQALLARRTAERTASAQRMVLTLTGSGVLAFALVAFAYYLVRRDTERRRQAEARLQETNQKLTTWVGELQQRTLEITLLGELADFLQTCRTTDEAFQVVGQFAGRLFPDHAGFLGVLRPSRDAVDDVAAWGDPESQKPTFSPDECWAIRSGRLFAVDGSHTAPMCGHFSSAPSRGYLCVPMMAQGEPLGVLHVEGPAVVDSRRESIQRLAVSVAEHVALGLANLQLQERLRYQAIRDPLTDLFNRRYMEESLDREVRRAARHRRELGVIMLDLDHFKSFNDTSGHEAGDTLLRGLAGLLQTRIRAEDIACRYGGEEFTVILPDASLDVTRQRAEQLRDRAQHLTVDYRGQLLGPLAISLGIAVFPQHGATGEELLRAADAALYRAKHEGRNRVVVAS